MIRESEADCGDQMFRESEADCGDQMIRESEELNMGELDRISSWKHVDSISYISLQM